MNPGIDAVLRAAVDSGAVPQVVAVAADTDGVVYEGAAGPRTAGGTEPVDADSVFRIASMTKMVCAVAALQLRERGRLDFAAPVESYCPEFAAVRVLDGFDGDRPRLRAPARRASVGQLLTHTAGFAYGFWNADLARWDATSGTGSVFDAPMVTDPGTRFEYGLAGDWLGRVVEAVSGRSLDAHLAEHVFGPLGMHSTGFVLDAAQRARCVPVHARTDDGAWTATGFDWDLRPRWFSGGHGLYSTPRDYLRFQRMLLGGGTLEGTAVLGRSSVREAFTPQLGRLGFPARIRTADPGWSCDFVADTELSWGWGLLLHTGERPGMRRTGSAGWAGAFNTCFWVDPAAGVTAAVHCQLLPFRAPSALQVCADVERALYAQLSAGITSRSNSSSPLRS